MSRCTHTHGRTLCFECFRAGMERTRARREAWAQRSLPFEGAASPAKPLTGDVKGAGEDKPKEKQPAAEAEAEPEKEGEMSPKQAARLLESMKDEEQKVQLDEHKAARRVYKDW